MALNPDLGMSTAPRFTLHLLHGRRAQNVRTRVRKVACDDDSNHERALRGHSCLRF